MPEPDAIMQIMPGRSYRCPEKSTHAQIGGDESFVASAPAGNGR